jgi:hypothetical protein
MYDRRILRWLPAALLGGVAIGLVTNSLAQSPGVNSNFPITWILPTDSPKRTYMQQITQLSAPAAGLGNDIFQLCGAPASIQTKVTKITFAGRATAVQPLDVLLIRRSTLDRSGTVTPGSPYVALSKTGIPMDVNDSAGQATVTPYVVSPTQVGTFVGTVAAAQAYMGNLTTGVSGPPTVFTFGDIPNKAMTLRSATDCVVVALSAATVAGGLFDITAEWTEEP